MHRSTIGLLALSAVVALGGCRKKVVVDELPPCEPRFVSVDGSCGAGAIAGKATFERRSNHGGIEVRLSGTDRISITDSEGRFSIWNVPAGSYSLEISARGFEEVSSLGLEVHSRAETEVDPVELRVADRRYGVRGRVLLDGAADHGQTRIAGPTRITITRPDGSFELGGFEAGTHHIRAEHDGYLAAEREVTFVDADVDLDDWTLERIPAPGLVSGRVTAQGTTAPLTGATVIAVGGGSAQSGADGRYDLELPPGTWTLRAGKPGYAAASATEVVVQSGKTTPLDLSLVPGKGGSAITGFAYVLGGDDHRGIEVELTDGETTLRTVTRSDGAWEMLEVTEGLYELRATVAGLGMEIRPGVTVDAGLNMAPTVYVSRAIRIADRSSWWEIPLPRTGRAILQFSSSERSPDLAAARVDDGLSIFDSRTRELRPLLEGSYWVMAIDPEERFATVSRNSDGAILRLSLEDGATDPVAPDMGGYQYSEAGVSIFIRDGVLSLLPASERVPEVLELPCPLYGWGLWMWGFWDDGRRAKMGLSTTCGYFEAAIDLAYGFAGPIGDSIDWSYGDRGITLRTVGGLREAFWTDLDRRVTKSLPGPFQTSFWSGTYFTYLADEDDGTQTIWGVEMASGSLYSLAGVTAAAPFGGNSILVATPADLRWLAADWTGTGTICPISSPSFRAGQVRTVACIDPGGSLRVFDERSQTVQTWADGAAELMSVSDSFVLWRSGGGLHRIRDLDAPGSVDIGCTGFGAVLSTSNPNQLIYACGSLVRDSTYWAVDTASLEAFRLASGTLECEFAPGFDTAVCREVCDAGTCVSIRDVRDETSTVLGAVDDSLDRATWSDDGASVGFIAGGPWFARKVGGVWTGASCAGVPGAIVRTLDGASHGLVVDESGAATLCAASGASSSAGVVEDWWWSPPRIPGTAKLVLADAVVDLAAGTTRPIAPSISQSAIVAGELYAVDEGGALLRFDSSGGTATIAEDVSGFADDSDRVVVARDEDGGVSIWRLDGGSLARVTDPFFGTEWFDGVVLLYGRPDARGDLPVTLLHPDGWTAFRTGVTVDPSGWIWTGPDSLYFPSGDGGLVRVSHTGEVVRFGSGSELVAQDREGRAFFTSGDLLWHDSAQGPLPLLQGIDPWVSSSTGSAFVLNAPEPSACYWYEVSR